MVLKKDKRTGVYHAHIKDQAGKRRSVTTKQKDRAKAKEVAEAAKIEELEKVASVTRLTGEVITRIVEGKKVSMKEAYNRWVAFLKDDHDEHTVYTLSNRIKVWLDRQHLWDRKVHEVTAADVDTYINKTVTTMNMSSLQATLSHIRQFLDYCHKVGWTTTNVAKTLGVRMDRLTHDQKERRPINVFTADEVRKILANTEGFWKAAVALAYYCGLRISDICQLEWRSTGTPGRLIVWTDKADVRLNVPLPTAVLNILSEMPVVSSRYMFPDEREINLSPTRRALLSVNFKNLLTRLGIEGKTFHGLRHTYAKKLELAGFTEQQIAEAMAHRDLDSQKTYLKH